MRMPAIKTIRQEEEQIMASILETVMLVCFGLSWPINAAKAYRSRTAKGMSLPFLLLILTGYLGGITAKLINGQLNYVLIVFFINLAIVLVNIAIYIRNVILDKKSQGIVCSMIKSATASNA